MAVARERVFVSWSGGKDSCMALHALRVAGEYDVAGLLTTVRREDGRVGMHGVSRELIERQAAALGLPLTIVDREEAVVTAQQLFHARGYDAVSVAELTGALGINPPSFYAAFGNKAGLYTQILERWAETGAIPLVDILRPDRPVAEALAAVLEEDARRYAANPDAAGCLVIEGTRCKDPEARGAARAANQAGERLIRNYIAVRHPAEATRVADFVSTTLSGLSAKARDGHGLDRLLATARLASLAVRQAFA